MNVPIENGQVVNDYRLRQAVLTLRYLTERGARVIVISHIGEAGTETLAPVATALGKLIPNVSFFGETTGSRARDAVRNLLPGHILVLENLRRSRGEQTNDPEFVKELVSLADIFVEDSFDTCHRRHASITGVPKILPAYAGLTLEKEVQELTAALAPKNPSLAIIGGAKFSTKEAVLTTLLQTYGHVFVGGALANDFLQASGHPVGRSLVGHADPNAIQQIITHKKLVLPVDVLVVSARVAFSKEARNRVRVADVSDVHADDMILDHGPGTCALLDTLVMQSRTVLWNGPLGYYENGFTDGTDACAQSIAMSNSRSVIGGGDTIASVERLGLLSKFSFVSTGGGAMLDFLANGTLPGIAVLGS